jgi:hypothetical protein
MNCFSRPAPLTDLIKEFEAKNPNIKIEPLDSPSVFSVHTLVIKKTDCVYFFCSGIF